MKKLPKWVYKTLWKYGNVALPNVVNDMDKEQLAKHLGDEIGVKVCIREVQFRAKDNFGHIREAPYYIAEVKR